MSELLSFQDFSKADDLQFTSANFNDDPRHHSATGDSSRLVTSGETSIGSGGSGKIDDGSNRPHLFSLSYYQQYFEVDTDQVINRIFHSCYPKPGSNFINDHVQATPDLYGPFWIGATLVFSMAICGNIANYIQSDGATATAFQSDFAFVTGSTSLVLFYVLVMPFLIYSVLWHRKATLQYPYVELVCVYGYSLSVFVPVSVLWVVNNGAFRWLLILLSVALSGTVLVKSLWPALRSDPNRLMALGLLAMVFAAHTLLAISFKQYYFDRAHSEQPSAMHAVHEGKQEIPAAASVQQPPQAPAAAALLGAPSGQATEMQASAEGEGDRQTTTTTMTSTTGEEKSKLQPPALPRRPPQGDAATRMSKRLMERAKFSPRVGQKITDPSPSANPNSKGTEEQQTAN